MRRFLVLWLICILGSWPLVPEAARTFVDGQLLQYSAALITATPMTICAWVRPTAAVTMGLATIGTIGTDNERYALQINSAGVAIWTVRNTANFNTQTTATRTLNVWQLACGVSLSDTSQAVYLNGGNKITGSHAPNPVPSGMNATRLAVDVFSAGGREVNGDLGLVMFWSAALNDQEIAALWTGAHPRKIRPESLVSCPHVRGDMSPEIDECGARTWALTGTPTRTTSGPPIGLFTRPFGS